MVWKLTEIVGTLTPYVFSTENYNRSRIISATLLDVVATGVETTVPFFISGFIEVDEEVLYTAAASYLLVQVLPKLRDLILNPVRGNVQTQLTEAMLKKSFELDLDYHLTVKTGEVTQALGRNYTTVDKAISSFFGGVSPLLLKVVAYTAALTYACGLLGLFQLAIVSNYLIVAMIREGYAKDAREACVNYASVTYGRFLEGYGNYRIAHQFGNIPLELDKTRETLTKYDDLYTKVLRGDDATALSLSIINIFGTAGALLLAIRFLPGGLSDRPNFILFVFFTLRLNFLLDVFPSTVRELGTALVDAQKVVNFLNKKIPARQAEMPLPDFRSPEIVFRNVTFFHGTTKILDDISFTVPGGKRVAIVGPSGAGKSTLLSLLLRFYDPSAGFISIGGVDIQTVTLTSLRAQIGIVSQDALLFNATIAENIKYGDVSAPDEEIAGAAKLSELADESNVERKLAESAGQYGGKLSGGEKQRVAIARALLKNPAIYALDEATAALDLETEREVQKTIDALTATGVTTLLVTHHLMTTVNTDLIIYLDRGKVIEQGTFSELVSRKGSFYNLLSVECEQLQVPVSSIVPVSDRTANERAYRALNSYRASQEQRRMRREQTIINVQGQEWSEGNGLNQRLLNPFISYE